MADFPIPTAEWTPQRWLDVFMSTLRWTAAPGENPHLVLAFTGGLGKIRAQALNRDFMAGGDVAHALSIYCWWPFKPPIPADFQQYLIEKRGVALRAARDFFQSPADAISALDPRREMPAGFYDAVLAGTFEDDLLSRLAMSTDDLYAWQLSGIGTH